MYILIYKNFELKLIFNILVAFKIYDMDKDGFISNGNYKINKLQN
jgi:hypothetical protein